MNASINEYIQTNYETVIDGNRASLQEFLRYVRDNGVVVEVRLNVTNEALRVEVRRIFSATLVEQHNVVEAILEEYDAEQEMDAFVTEQELSGRTVSPDSSDEELDDEKEIEWLDSMEHRGHFIGIRYDERGYRRYYWCDLNEAEQGFYGEPSSRPYTTVREAMECAVEEIDDFLGEEDDTEVFYESCELPIHSYVIKAGDGVIVLESITPYVETFLNSGILDNCVNVERWECGDVKNYNEHTLYCDILSGWWCGMTCDLDPNYRMWYDGTYNLKNGFDVIEIESEELEVGMMLIDPDGQGILTVDYIVGLESPLQYKVKYFQLEEPRVYPTGHILYLYTED